MPQRRRAKIIFLAASGLAAGFINGLLGAGGGIICVFALGYLLREREDGGREAFVNTLALMLPLTAISTVGYALAGVLPDERLGRLALPALAGGFVGGVLLERLDTKWLRLIFALLVIWSGISMLR